MNVVSDAVVVGAGINGMVAAAELALGGWSVTVVDERRHIGGFIESKELTRPGFLHDTFSSWHPLFVAGPAYEVLGEKLAERGLAYRNSSEAVTASVSTERGHCVAYRDAERTVETFSVPRDRDAYLKMLEQFGADSKHIFGAMGAELNAKNMRQLGWGMWRERKTAGSTEMVRTALQSGRSYARERFDGWEPDQLWAPWLLHAGLSPDQAMGGTMFPVMAATMHGIGLPVVEGGAAEFVDAFGELLSDLKVTTILESTVDAVEIEGGRAVGVRVDGNLIRARRAVIASASPSDLYERLLPSDVVPRVVREQVGRFRPGRGAMQIHLALSKPPVWSESSLDDVPLIHISSGSASTGVACAQAEAGLLPSSPTVVVGQQFRLDPSRVPDGCASLWIQLQEVPYSPSGDALDQLNTENGWSPDLVDGFADRVIDQIAAHAPGVRESILDSHLISPVGLEQANRNAVHGDPYGGSAEIDQSFVWRPVPAAANHRTCVGGLWHIGASTHPGPGLGGGSGHLVAQQLLSKPWFRK